MLERQVAEKCGLGAIFSSRGTSSGSSKLGSPPAVFTGPGCHRKVGQEHTLSSFSAQVETLSGCPSPGSNSRAGNNEDCLPSRLVPWNFCVRSFTYSSICRSSVGNTRACTENHRRNLVVGWGRDRLCKVALKESARRRLQAEHHVLSRLPRGLGPQVLRYGSWQSGEALLITPLRGHRVSPNLPPPAGLRGWFNSLQLSPGIEVDAHPHISHLRRARENCVGEIVCALRRRTWPLVVHHGDLAPWNIVQAPTGQVFALDWEYGSLSGFPYLDLVHYSLQVCALIYRWKPVESLHYTVRYLTRPEWPGLARDEAVALVRLAAFDAYCKSLEDGNGESEPLQIWRRQVWQHLD